MASEYSVQLELLKERFGPMLVKMLAALRREMLDRGINTTIESLVKVLYERVEAGKL